MLIQVHLLREYLSHLLKSSKFSKKKVWPRNSGLFLYLACMEKLGLIKVALKAISALINVLALLLQYVKLNDKDFERISNLVDSLEGVHDLLYEFLNKK